jgi:hypothetical protein
MHIGWWGSQGLKNWNYAIGCLWILGLLTVLFVKLSYFVALVGIIVIGCKRGAFIINRDEDSMATEPAPN